MIIVLVTLAGCGRVGFDAIGTGDSDARLDGAGSGDIPDAFHLGPVFELPFETDFLKDPAGGRDGTCTSCPSATPGIHAGTSAASFDGSRCVYAAGGALRPSQFTFAAWERPNDQRKETIFSRPFNGATSSEDTFELYMLAGASDVFVIAGDTTLQMTMPNAVGIWHHVAGTFDGTTLITYLDGVMVTSRAGLLPSPYADDPFMIGCDRDAGVEQSNFDGTIDEVKLYDRVLSAAEIAVLATP